MRHLNSTLCRLLVAALLMLPASFAFSEAPPFTPFQARVLDADQRPRTLAADLAVRLWRSPDSRELADLVYEEAHAAVSFADGVFGLSIGSGEPTAGHYDAASLAGPGVWLEIEIDGETLTPRLPFESAPYALRAQHAAEADNVGGIPAPALLRSDSNAVFSGPTLTIARSARLDVEGEMRVMSNEGIRLLPGGAGAGAGLRFNPEDASIEIDTDVVAPEFFYRQPLQRYLAIPGNAFMDGTGHDWRRGPGYGYSYDRDYNYDLYAPVYLPTGAIVTSLLCRGINNTFGDDYAHYTATLQALGHPTSAEYPGRTVAAVEDTLSEDPIIGQPGITQEATGTVSEPFEPIDNETRTYFMRVRWNDITPAGSGGYGGRLFYGCRIGYTVSGP